MLIRAAVAPKFTKYLVYALVCILQERSGVALENILFISEILYQADFKDGAPARDVHATYCA